MIITILEFVFVTTISYFVGRYSKNIKNIEAFDPKEVIPFVESTGETDKERIKMMLLATWLMKRVME